MQNNFEMNENMEAINKLLLDMTQNQKESNRNLVKVFIATIICFTILLISMVVGFFVYESQYEFIDSGYGYEYNYEYEQEAESGENGTAIVNGNGEVNYGTSEIKDEGDN